MIKNVHVIILGNVTGVGFRYWTKTKADSFGLYGWIKNIGDQVEVVFQGEEDKLMKILVLIKKGPPGSDVKKIVVEWNQTQTMVNRFEIKR